MEEKKIFIVLRRWRPPKFKKKGWHIVFVTDCEEESEVTGADNEFAEYYSCQTTIQVPE